MTQRHGITKSILFLSLVCASFSARAASPTVTSLSAQSGIVGENVPFHADVADTDGNLQAVVFYVSGPGITGWLNVGTRPVTGAQASADLSWSPPGMGVYTVRADVVDPTTGGSAQRIFEVFVERKIVTSTTLPSGTGFLITANGEIKTQENLSGDSVVASAGSNLVLWAAGRVLLKPGFKARSGSFFWAAVDHNNNGYSDVEESTDSDGDGIPDAWEVDHGLNMNNPVDASTFAPGLGMTYLQAYQNGKDPGGPNSLPPTFNTRDNDIDGIPIGIKTLLGASVRSLAQIDAVGNVSTQLKISTPQAQ